MAVKIRLTRVGRVKSPVYRIVVMDERNKRDGAALEWIGTYDPIKEKLLQYHQDRAAFWIGQGAQCTNAVKKIVRLHSVVAPQVPAA